MSNTAQTITYQTDNSVISNPEKGFYHYTSTGSSGGYTLLSQATLDGYRTSENITTIQRIFFLRDFISGTRITNEYLTNMQTDFNTIRAAGAKVIIRFTYSSSSSTTIFQPTKAQILIHMKQLNAVLRANKDVIVSIQAGFIGKYGEWYYTGSSELGDGDFTNLTNIQWANRKEIFDYMQANFPPEIPLQLRYVFAKQKMYGTTFIGRIGFYNDSFLGTWGDSGTFLVGSANGSPNTADVTYWLKSTENNPVTGETNMVNAPRTACSNAMLEMDRFNWSLINKDYFPTVITDWQTNGCFTEMQKNLGYNFRLNSSSISSGRLTINIGNYGYANLFKVRRAILICKNTTTNVNYSYVIDTNLRGLTTTDRVITVSLATLGLPVGEYKLLLSLPDPNTSLASNPKYAIRCSNLNTWTAEGFNDLLLTYSVVGIGVVNNQISTTDGAVIEAKIYNTSGTIVSRKTDVSDLPNGLYIVKAKTNQGNDITQKIRISR